MMKEPSAAWNPSATQCEIDPLVKAYAFDLQGFLHLPNALKAAQVGWIRTWEDLNCPAGSSGWLNQVEYFGPRETERRIYCNLIEGGEVFEALMDHPRWFEVLSPDACEDSLSLVTSELVVGPKMTGFSTSPLTVVLVALDDTADLNQIVRVVPGSHRTKLKHPSESTPGKWGDLLTQDIPLRPGDALLMKPGLCQSFCIDYVSRARFVRLGYAGSPYVGEFYCPSRELLQRLTPPRRALLGRFIPRTSTPFERAH